MFKKIFFSLITVGLLAYGCSGDGSLLLQDASGEMAEMVVVIDSKIKPNSALKDSVNNFFTHEIKGLPQGEKFFKIINIDEANFGNIFKIHRNVLMFTVKPDQNVPGYATKKNAWSRGQLVVQVLAKNEYGFQTFFDKNKEFIEGLFWEAEVERMSKEFKKIQNKAVSDDVKSTTGVEMTIPEGFYTIIKDKNFIYTKHEATKSVGKGLSSEINRGISVYTFPYTDKKAFSIHNLLTLRDSLTKVHIRGSKDSSFMKTESLLPPDSSAITLNGQYALVMRGLWRMSNEFKGGPYLTILGYDKPKNRVIYLDGFVYAPAFNKRNYVFQMEGILRTAKF